MLGFPDLDTLFLGALSIAVLMLAATAFVKLGEALLTRLLAWHRIARLANRGIASGLRADRGQR